MDLLDFNKLRASKSNLPLREQQKESCHCEEHSDEAIP
jgi:hypothetical protein